MAQSWFRRSIPFTRTHTSTLPGLECNASAGLSVLDNAWWLYSHNTVYWLSICSPHPQVPGTARPVSREGAQPVGGTFTVLNPNPIY